MSAELLERSGFRGEVGSMAASFGLGRGGTAPLGTAPADCCLSAMVAEALRPEAAAAAGSAPDQGAKGSHASRSATAKGAMPWFRSPSAVTERETPAGPSPTVSTPSPTGLALRSLSVEETIVLRDVFDTWTEVQPAPVVANSGDDLPDSPLEGYPPARGPAAYQPLYLDVFHVTALLSRAGIQVPAGSDLRKIIAKVQSINSSKTESAVSAASSAYLYPAGTDVRGPRAPVLSFEMFCQVAELTKRLALRNRDTSTDVGDTFMRISRNKARVTSAFGSTRRHSSVSPGASSLAAGSTSVESLCLDSFDAAPALAIEQMKSSTSKTSIPAGLLQDMLRHAGTDFDILTLMRSLKKDFDGTVDADAFRWISGSEDPDIVKAFVALGGEPTLSGSVPTSMLISKCSAMKMSPQAVANFVAKVDANGDGFVDYNEFVSMLLQQKLSQQEANMENSWTKSQGSIRVTTPEASAPSEATREGMPFPTGVPALRPRASFFKRDTSSADDETPLEVESRDGSGNSTPKQSGSDRSLDVDDVAEEHKMMSRERSAHHLHMGLSDLLASSLKLKSEKNLQQRIDDVVTKGRDSVLRCRNRADACVDTRPTCLIRTDEGLVDATRSSEPPLLQRARLKRLRQQAEEQARVQSAAPVSPRLTTLPKRREQLLEERVKAAADELRQQEALAAARAARRATTPRVAAVAVSTEEPFAAQPAEVQEQPSSSLKTHQKNVTSPRTVQTAAAAAPVAQSRRPQTPRINHTDLRDELRIFPANEMFLRNKGNSSPAQGIHRAHIRSSPSPVVPASRPKTVTPTAAYAPTAAGPAQPPRKQQEMLDDQLLWKLLDYNYYAQRDASQHAGHVGDAAPSNIMDPDRYLSSVAARRIYARTMASHLALQLPYDDELMIGDVAKCITPMALRTAAVSRAYSARAGSSNRNSRPPSTDPSSVSPLVQAITIPSRPTTAPSRRPASATARGVPRPPSSRLRSIRDEDDDDDSDTMYLS